MGRPIRIPRRTVLRGFCASLALPWLEAMADEPRDQRRPGAVPPRLACFYVPGCILRPAWFPADDGPGYTLPPTLKRIERHRARFTVVRGLQHIRGQIAGHPHAMNWLTGHNINEIPGVFPNTISFDQVFAQHFGNTYLPSLVLSHSSGGGANTLSRDTLGADIPAIAKPLDVFARLFAPADPARVALQQRRMADERSILDELRGGLADLGRDLGHVDRRRLDEYAESVRDIERRIAVRQEIIATPRGEPDLGDAKLGIRTGNGARWKECLEAMMDLIALGFQADMTRVATYALGEEIGPRYAEYDEWVKATGSEVGASRGGVHQIHHAGGEVEDLANPVAKLMLLRDGLLIDALGRLLDKLAAIPAREGTLLDHTQILFGGAQARTHTAVDMPILVAGGARLGWKHGHCRTYWKPAVGAKRVQGHLVGAGSRPTVPLSDLFLTMLQQAGCPVTSFKESRGPLSDLLR